MLNDSEAEGLSDSETDSETEGLKERLSDSETEGLKLTLTDGDGDPNVSQNVLGLSWLLYSVAIQSSVLTASSTFTSSTSTEP